MALALGLLIGLERGWQGREQAEGTRVAGIRTFALIGLLGGVWGLLAEQLGPAVLAAAFAVLAIVLATAHALSQIQDHDVGVTGVIASLLTFALGAMATLGYGEIAAAGAVVTTILLGVKPTLHRWVRRLEEKELHAVLKLLLISVVILPLLPNQGYGPWEALNPYRIWWMVVLIAAISFVGYFATKLIGERRGIMATGLFGGLASSTALTVNFSRLARGRPGSENILAAGILAACATMFPRILVVSSIFSWTLASTLLWPVIAMTIVNYSGAALFWYWSGKSSSQGGGARLKNPFELKPALIFAALLAAIMLLSRALSEYFGDAGVYLLAAASGIADVDAITLSLANMTGEDLAVTVATLAVLIAAFVNATVKAGLSLGIGGFALGARVGGVTMAVVGVGLLTWWFSA
ncbi:MgtC/SapB family protein [Thioalkalivibrio sp.]|uniref:MgtC/SapB family protein n=1 Tax=Thioalkalivibrio sp. TaxID=2093813 RepID=UPI003975915D